MVFIGACVVSLVKIAFLHLDDLDLFTHHYRPGLVSLLRNLPRAPKAMLFIPLILDLFLILHSHVTVVTVSRTVSSLPLGVPHPRDAYFIYLCLLALDIDHVLINYLMYGIKFICIPISLKTVKQV